MPAAKLLTSGVLVAAATAGTVSAAAATAPSARTPSDAVLGNRRFVQPLAVETGWNASDGFQSHRLPDGRILWLYGDTVTDDGRFVRNSMSVWDRREGYIRFDAGTDLRGFAVRPDTRAADGATRWYWTGVPLPGSGQRWVHIPAMRVQRTSGGFGFELAGADMITYRYASASARLTVVANRSTPRVVNAAGTDMVWWGAATVRVRDHVYIYGMITPSGAGSGYRIDTAVMRIRSAVLARRPPRVADWQVLTDDGWRTGTGVPVSAVRRIAHRFSNSFGIVAVRGKLYAVVKTDEFLGRTVDLYRAASVRSPFRFRRRLAIVRPAADTFAYNVNLHQALPAPRGRVWVSVNQSPRTCAAWTCPTSYRPIFRLIPAPHRFPGL